uniref:Uncharacterized protein n=1 Tax=Oryza glumipatula TaxID=40148 RepID=A0A0E0AAW9_9ORYZ
MAWRMAAAQRWRLPVGGGGCMGSDVSPPSSQIRLRQRRRGGGGWGWGVEGSWAVASPLSSPSWWRQRRWAAATSPPDLASSGGCFRLLTVVVRVFLSRDRGRFLHDAFLFITLLPHGRRWSRPATIVLVSFSRAELRGMGCPRAVLQPRI